MSNGKRAETMKEWDLVWSPTPCGHNHQVDAGTLRAFMIDQGTRYAWHVGTARADGGIEEPHLRCGYEHFRAVAFFAAEQTLAELVAPGSVA